MLGNAEPALFVTDPRRVEELGEAARQAGVREILTLDADGRGSLADAAAREPAEREPELLTRDDLGAMLYTSGTTGRPKGAPLSHGNLASNALVLAEAWGFTADDVLLHALPIFHVHGLFVACHCVLMAGARMIWLPRFDAKQVMAPAAALHRDDGRADLLHPAPRRAGLRPRADRQHPPLRLRLGPAARRDPPRVRGPHRPPHPRALRHERDRHAHLEPAGRRAAPGQRRPAAGGLGGADRGRRRPRPAAGRGRQRPRPRPQRLRRLLAGAREERAGVRSTAGSGPATWARSARTAT